mgnify:CR=1 FL=1
MKQNLKISVSKKSKSDGILSCRSINVRERILCFFLGRKQKITILVPGDSVEEVAICTVKEGGMEL